MPRSTPFWTFALREKRDVLAVRQKARQIAHLLHYSPLEQACIAAGVFTIADQARMAYSAPEICFQLEHQQLTVSARALPGSTTHADRPLLKLSKPLPEAARNFACDDLGWLIGRINDQTGTDLYAEMRAQNEEVLHLLHLLQHPEEMKAPAESAA